MKTTEAMTLFTTPKAFRGLFGVIQTNAIRSWALLRPRPEIILFGDDEGTAEIARKLGLGHVPSLKRNQYGTPLVNELFGGAANMASHDLMGYVNADIILMDDFTTAITKVRRFLKRSDFLIVGRKIQVERKELLSFESGWAPRLREIARREGKYVTPDSDYFVFPKGLYREIPPFAIGRCFWSPWFVYSARKQGARVIDATELVTAVEFKHDYSHVASTGHAPRLRGPEYELNRKLFQSCKYFTTVDATHVIKPSGLEPRQLKRRVLSLTTRAHYFVYFLAKGRLYPYSLPLIFLYRLGRRIARSLAIRKRQRLHVQLSTRPEQR